MIKMKPFSLVLEESEDCKKSFYQYLSWAGVRLKYLLPA
ncbi:hypothetical protein MY7_1674 [Bacillus sp. 5B6]|nr:hypothetical protein MY7_1674 [Bacillus sp. 5B6]